MKILIIIAAVLLLLVIAFQIWAYSTIHNIETYPYKVIKKYKEFEVRQYEAANFSYTTISTDNYKKSSGNGFRVLAGYIFGGNKSKQSIAMTSPVEMELKDSITMKFLIPAEYAIEDLPEPTDDRVKFKQENAKRLAAIRFGGWANDKKIERYQSKLASLLEKEGIEHNGSFSYLGYNPPFLWINRRNEIVVELK